MHGARAVLKEIVESFPDAKLRVFVVWMPMVPGDSPDAARRTGAMYPTRVHQFYDPECDLGRTFGAQVFDRNCLRAALRATPRDHPLHERLERWTRDSAERMVWDAVLYYPAGVEWKSGPPSPVYWSKQIGYGGPPREGVTGTFFHDDCASPPVDTDWFPEVRRSIHRLVSRMSATPTPANAL